MTESLWIDLAACGLLALFGWLFWRSEKHSILGTESIEFDAQESQSPGYGSRLLRQCGLGPQGLLPFWALKLSFLILSPALLLEASPSLPWPALAASGVLAAFLPEAYLLLRRTRRRRLITNALGFFISLIVVYLRTGRTLAQAFADSAEHGLPSEHPLREEVRLIAREVAAGRDREEAFRLLAERTGVPEIRQLSAVIGVGLRAGAPITETLRSQAEWLQARHSQLSTQLVQRKSMESMLPMLLVCFPMFTVLVIFPAAIQLLDVLAMLGELF